MSTQNTMFNGNTFYEHIKESDAHAVVVVTHGLMRPREGWPILPMALVLRRRAMQSLPTFVNLIADDKSRLVDVAELLKAYIEVYKNKDMAKIHAARYRAFLELEDFILCRKPLIDFLIGFYARIATDEAPDGEFAISRRMVGALAGSQFLVTFLPPDILFEQKLGFWIRIVDMIDYFKKAVEAGPRLWGVLYYRIYSMDKAQIAQAKTAATFDDVIDKIIMDTVGRVPSNGVYVIGIDMSKDREDRGKTFLAPARRIATIPFLDALENVEVIANDDGSVAIILMYFSSMDPTKVDMISDDEVSRRVELSPERLTLINRKLGKTWYGRRVQQATAMDMKAIDAFLGGISPTPAGTPPTPPSGGEEEGGFVPVGPEEKV